MICLCCGNQYNSHKTHDESFYPSYKAKVGRPSSYCSPECRNFVKYKNAMEKQLEHIQFTTEASKLIRGDFFSLVNKINHEHTK